MRSRSRRQFPIRQPALVSVPVQGVGSIWSWAGSFFTGYDSAELQAQSQALDEQLARLNQEAHATGHVDQATYEATVQHLAAQIEATQQIPEDIDQAFIDGALEG